MEPLGPASALLASFGRAQKLQKKRVWGKGPRFKLGMELDAQKKRMDLLRQFRYFHKHAIRGFARKNQTGFFELGDIFWVDFITVPVTFGNFVGAVSFGRHA